MVVRRRPAARWSRRDDLLQELIGAALDAGNALGGKVILLTGEAGIGKTTVARALVSAVRDGFDTSSGTTIVDGSAPPFWPWRPVLDGDARRRTHGAGAVRSGDRSGTVRASQCAPGSADPAARPSAAAPRDRGPPMGRRRSIEEVRAEATAKEPRPSKELAGAIVPKRKAAQVTVATRERIFMAPLRYFMSVQLSLTITTVSISITEILVQKYNTARFEKRVFPPRDTKFRE